MKPRKERRKKKSYSNFNQIIFFLETEQTHRLIPMNHFT
jgi:hypothetical protein